MSNSLTLQMQNPTPHCNHAGARARQGVRRAARRGAGLTLENRQVSHAVVELSRLTWLFGTASYAPHSWSTPHARSPPQSFMSLLKSDSKAHPDQGLVYLSSLIFPQTPPLTLSYTELFLVSGIVLALSPTPLRGDYTDEGQTIYDNRSLTHNLHSTRPRPWSVATGCPIFCQHFQLRINQGKTELPPNPITWNASSCHVSLSTSEAFPL